MNLMKDCEPLTPKIISGSFRTVGFSVDGDDHVLALVEESHLPHGGHKVVDGQRFAQKHVNCQIQYQTYSEIDPLTLTYLIGFSIVVELIFNRIDMHAYYLVVFQNI